MCQTMQTTQMLSCSMDIQLTLK